MESLHVSGGGKVTIILVAYSEGGNGSDLLSTNCSSKVQNFTGTVFVLVSIIKFHET